MEFDETGATVAFGDGSVRPGQAIFADFAHVDSTRGTALIRVVAMAVGDVNGGRCPSDSIIGTVEGFDSTTMMTHTIQNTQLILRGQ